MLCNHGSNGFRADSSSGVYVVVEASHSGGFAEHACTAELRRSKETLTVADQAAQVDLDLFDVEVGLPGPVAAFQLQHSEQNCCLSYEIYSMRGPLRLLRTLQGGFFHAADTDLDGRVEIWAEDGEAVNGLDELPVSLFAFLPTYVLRFENERLVDATREFAPHFDQIIQDLRAKLSRDQLADFKKSDGKLAFSINGMERLRDLRATKIAVLEIVWSYLYSGREDQAWNTVREMWPVGDAGRIQSVIVDRRKRGILAQLDGVSTAPGRQKHCPIFKQSEVTSAGPIDISFPAVPTSTAEVDFDLIIDSAGKVRQIKTAASLDPYILDYVRAWKFIPAMKGGHSVASHLRIAVSMKR
jgi:hypothetical protein